MSASLSPQMHTEFQKFANWIISVGASNISAIKVYEDNESSWIKTVNVSH